MARPLRLLVANGVYHVMARGNDKAAIYHDAADNAAFLDHVERTVERFGWRCFSYCLMVNHFHLLLQTPQPNLSRGVQYLKTAYAQYHNRRHEQTGHVFGDRFKSPLIQQDAHLLAVFRYIALNPVRAGLCRDPGSWPWSAHSALAGRITAPDFLDVAGAHAWFGSSCDAHAYELFVSGTPDIEYEPRGAVFGDAEFKRSVLPSRRPDRDVAVRDWGEGRPPLAEVLERWSRPEGVSIAYRNYGYPLAAIARALGCDVSTAGRWLREYEDGMSEC